jgi:hypothetical protein
MASTGAPAYDDRACGVWCNVVMTLSDGEVAELARAAADRVAPNVDVQIEPADPVDPYRWETAAWTVRVGAASSYIIGSMTAEEAFEKLVRDLGPDRP